MNSLPDQFRWRVLRSFLQSTIEILKERTSEDL